MKLKILIILLGLYLFGTIIGFWQVYRFRKENISLKETIEELETKKRIAEMRLRDKEAEIAKLLSEIEEKTKQISSLEDQIKNEKMLREEIASQLKKKETELAKEKERSLELEDKLNKSEIEFKNLLVRVKDLESKRIDLEKKLKDLEAKATPVELGKIGIRGEKEVIPAKLPKRLEGKILAVNRDYNFAVVNLGKEDGLNLSDTLSIWRRNKHLGNVKVEELRDKMCVITFLDIGIKDKIKEEDLVILSF